MVTTVPKVLPDILFAFIPYTFVLAIFGAFVVWNGGIVLAATFFGWPTLISGPGGPMELFSSLRARMFGSKMFAVSKH
ncbi:hypothetical protein JR316_0001119 [Psilocybe cubensis]|uniref:Uncharacterized protein n=1 Tax=Psilocybe cubensis TaxID=181762 RepID=A0ACB8HGA0_PSICU|nr:hypothetical protein JR316_0001119 [Psilocybe cubensis]KAH9487053.1 hypothetical protein JR316_0001119 [Psilocybe cubensis]